MLLYAMKPTTAPGNITIRTIATHFWDARQPEVDNLLARIGALSASNTKWKELHNDLTKQLLNSQQENGRLKAEVKLRAEKDMTHFYKHREAETISAAIAATVSEIEPHYAELEREHMGDPGNGTGIYADSMPSEQLRRAAQDVMKVLGFLLYSPKDGDTYRVIFNLSKALKEVKS